MDAATRFRALFETHHAAVRRYAHHRSLSGADAEDLVAETFTVAWRRIDAVPADDALPWLLGVAANVRRNQLRSGRRYMTALGLLPPPETSPPPAEPSDDAQRLRRALNTLTLEDQEILRLVAWDGLTPRQAAAVLGCPDGTARARLHRARRRLAARLDEDEDGAGPSPGRGPQEQRPPPRGQFVGDATQSRGGRS